MEGSRKNDKMLLRGDSEYRKKHRKKNMCKKYCRSHIMFLSSLKNVNFYNFFAKAC